MQAELSKAELRARDADDDPDDRVTADEWRAAHEEAVADDDQHREITEDDIHYDVAETDTVDPTGDAAWADIREQAEAQPRQTREDIVAVPSAEDTADHVRYAGRVLDEINYRQAGDAQHEAEERAAELARWYGDDVAEQSTGDVHEDDDYERVDRL
ncbi:hypothetical protein [Pseudonocardia parietis]|uniref:OsmC-like protein n=1 Tax=Pseudonocardia parietis TaxID=570936 RepID=A0ABS4VSQ8_9PSEU|nr:hypothetical protein [Pseudonocardia parietis]MBP2366758.1 putative OsmC-like protein [Pseudonocardia parietis]